MLFSTHDLVTALLMSSVTVTTVNKRINRLFERRLRIICNDKLSSYGKLCKHRPPKRTGANYADTYHDLCIQNKKGPLL